jgi:hypothetical protein
VSDEFGGFIGGATTLSFPNPKYVAWKICDALPFTKCGSRPARTLRKTIDTTTGAEASISTSGRAGLELHYALDAGSVGAELEYKASADFTLARTGSGKVVRVASSSDLVSGRMESDSPTARASVDVVADITLDVSTSGCLAGKCVSDELNLINVDGFRKELISIDPTEVNYLDGFLPELLKFSTPIGDVPTSLEADLVTKKLALNTNVNNDTGEPGDPSDPKTKKETKVPSDEPDSGLLIELARLDAKIPLLSMEGEMSAADDSITLDGKADFVALRADIDGLLTYANVLPPLGVRADFGEFLSGSVDLMDIEAGPKIDVFQTFKLTQNLMVDIAFDREVDLFGTGLTDSWSGLWEDLPDFGLLGATTLTPTFWTEAMLRSTTGFDFGADFALDLLKGNITVGSGKFTFFKGAFGPVFKAGDEVSFGRLDLFDDEFALGGFNRFEGAPIIFGGRGSISAVPLPAGSWFLISGLAGLGTMRRWRARS